MAHEHFEGLLLRLLAAELWLMVSMAASREMLGKSYFALGVAEKTSLDHWVAGTIAANFFSITPQLLRFHPTPVAGFDQNLPAYPDYRERWTSSGSGEQAGSGFWGR